MGHVVLVRHGRAAAAWDADADPGLDEAGQRQAEQMASSLVLFGPLPLYSSPLRRCVETAQALGARWGVEPVIDPHVGEVESPTNDLAERGTWLRAFMQQTWDDQPQPLLDWRDRVVEAIRRIGDEGDAVIVSHFVAINAVVSHATGDPRVISFAPDNCSRTEVKVDGGRIEVVELGGQARTLVQ
ncbi:MAG TPA: histidine phosphatase family protein [Acidimicrobiales bacterium]|nr:histidine phosphatase family protein [Acidimicrobiales bacterium]